MDAQGTTFRLDNICHGSQFYSVINSEHAKEKYMRLEQNLIKESNLCACVYVQV